MGLATGCKTYKLKYGHRGPNHPVKNIEKETPLNLNLKKENKTENNTNSNNNKLKLSKQQSLSSFCYTPNKSIDKNHLSVQECDKSCSFNRSSSAHLL